MTLDDLYKMIPSVPCPSGCISCCKKFGIPSRNEEEDRRLKEYLKIHNIPGRVNDFEVSDEDNTCPYVTTKGCAVYPARPFICRLYGASPSYPCIENIKPFNMLTSEEEAEILRIYYELSRKS